MSSKTFQIPYLLAVLCCRGTEGYSLALLRHFFRHYISCGFNVDNIYVSVMHDGPYDDVKFLLNDLGIRIARELESKEYDPSEYTRERQFLQSLIPKEAWFVNPEPEEFIAFPKAIGDLVRDMDEAGFNVLSGWLWDRFDQAFLLKEILPDHPIHLQFPIAVEYSARVLFANTRKDVLAKNCFLIQSGAHCLDPNGSRLCPAPPPWHLRVDCYKWNSGAKARVNRLYDLYIKDPDKYSAAASCQWLRRAIQPSSRGDMITNDVPIRTAVTFNKSGAEKIRFIHIPKTAGTTVINVLNGWFRGVNRVNSWKSLSDLERTALREESIICGHIPLRYLPIDADNGSKWFTILRDPREQAISCYYEAAKNIAHRNPEMQDLIEEGLERLLLNGKFLQVWTDSTRYLSSLPKEAEMSQALESAKQNLQKFTLVGFYERLASFVGEMSKLLNQEPPKHLPWENKNTYKPGRVALSPEAMLCLEQIIQYDIELYNYAQQLFND